MCYVHGMHLGCVGSLPINGRVNQVGVSVSVAAVTSKERCESETVAVTGVCIQGGSSQRPTNTSCSVTSLGCTLRQAAIPDGALLE